jgi:RNA polymerase sigma factor (sigma-70 family)
MTAETDREIRDGFVSGREDAVVTVAGWVRAVVLRSLWGHESDAEDLVSDTLIKLLRLFSSGDFRAESSLKTYVCRVARYTAVDFLRHERRSRRLLTEDSLRAGSVPTPEDLYAEKERIQLFDRLQSLIDPRCKRLWEMIFTEHLAYADIASREGVAPGVIKVRVFRCKEEAMAVLERMRTRIPGGAWDDSKTGESAA